MDKEAVQRFVKSRGFEYSQQLTTILRGAPIDIITKCVKDYQRKYLFIQEQDPAKADEFTPEMWWRTQRCHDEEPNEPDDEPDEEPDDELDEEPERDSTHEEPRRGTVPTIIGRGTKTIIIISSSDEEPDENL
jgi:hypothetical protein